MASPAKAISNNSSEGAKGAKGLPVLVVIVSVALRMFAGFYLGNEVVDLPGTFDQISYHNLAIRVVEGYGFTFGQIWWPITPAGEPTAHWSYLYTLYLALIYSLVGVQPLVARLLQGVIVGILHPVLAYQLGLRSFNRKTGIIFAAITAIYIYFFYYAAALMTESFYITGILAALNFAVRLVQSEDRNKKMRNAIGLGVSLGLVILLRQLFLLMVPFILLWIWYVEYLKARKARFRESVVVVGLILAFVLPVTAFNYTRFGQFVLVNTNAGYAFFWGNHPVYGTQFQSILPRSMGTYQGLIPEEVRHLDEAALDKELLSRGIGFVLADPARYAQLSLSRIPGYFMFWPSAESGWLSNISRGLSFGIFLPFMLYGLFRFMKEEWFARRLRLTEILAQPQSLILIYGFVYTFIHLLTWTLIRYRLPVDAVMLMFAAFALEKSPGRKRSSLPDRN